MSELNLQMIPPLEFYMKQVEQFEADILKRNEAVNEMHSDMMVLISKSEAEKLSEPVGSTSSDSASECFDRDIKLFRNQSVSTFATFPVRMVSPPQKKPEHADLSDKTQTVSSQHSAQAPQTSRTSVSSQHSAQVPQTSRTSVSFQQSAQAPQTSRTSVSSQHSAQAPQTSRTSVSFQQSA